MREELNTQSEQPPEFSSAVTARELEADRESKRDADYTEWQREFDQKLGQLEDRIINLQEELQRESERTGDRQGTGQERSAEDEHALRQEIKQLRLKRVKLIESVPTEHVGEANQVRKDRGVLLPEMPV